MSLAGVAVNVLTLAWVLVTSVASRRLTVILLPLGALVVVQNLLPVRVKNRLGVAQSDGMRAVLALDADDAEIRSTLASRFMGEAYLCHVRGDPAAALAWDERGLEEHPGEALLEGDAAVAEIRLGAFDGARERLVRLAERTDLPQERRAVGLNNLAWADLMIGDPALLPEALSASKEAFEIMPGVPAIGNTRGYALIRQGAVEEGIELSTQALRRHATKDDRASTACVVAMGWARLGRLEPARRHLEAAIRLSPDNPLIDRALTELEGADVSRRLSSA